MQQIGISKTADSSLKLPMCAEVVLVRDGEGYRVVFGYLRLAAIMSASSELLVDVKGGGTALVFKTQNGLLVNKDNNQLPLLTG